MSKLYSFIEGKDIFTVSEEELEPIVEGILYKGQYAMFIAEEKVGKTILAQQLVCSLSTGKPLFNTFDITRPCKVWYMYNEVRDNELKERFIRMRRGVSADENNISLCPIKFRLNTPEGVQSLNEIIEEKVGNYPDVIVLDCLFKAIKGKITDEGMVNEFNHVFRNFAHELGGCARILVHHLTKPSRDSDGKYYRRSDKDSFGSAFLLADPDHIFRLEKWGEDPQTKDRVLKCDTQRSGDICDITKLRLIEPDPLHFEVVSIHSGEKDKLLKFLGGHGKRVFNDITRYTKIKKSTCYKVLKELQDDGIVSKTKSRPVFYELTAPNVVHNVAPKTGGEPQKPPVGI